MTPKSGKRSFTETHLDTLARLAAREFREVFLVEHIATPNK